MRPPLTKSKEEVLVEFRARAVMRILENKSAVLVDYFSKKFIFPTCKDF
jgi:hypothetical protein